MVKRYMFLEGYWKKEAPPSRMTHKPYGFIFGIMGLATTQERGAYDSVYQSVDHKTTVFNDQKV